MGIILGYNSYCYYCYCWIEVDYIGGDLVYFLKRPLFSRFGSFSCRNLFLPGNMSDCLWNLRINYYSNS